ncbi:hypothetical protein POTOM_027692 [Populus tomentosa]|uniref:Uncharacterized protein n=1 Tax=Populus tomentosa TaxID=118781 RepID=A0A8X7ZD54_POPTO|nr:hypothetical protein POTOM_027692 [Populus tomentosa]
MFGESEKGHGVFGEGSGMFPPKETSTTTTTNYADENELLNEELDGVTSDQNARYETGNQNNNGYTNKYYNNGYKLAGESYEAGNQNTENGYSNNGNTNNYNNNGYTNKYYNNGYKLAGESYEAGNQNSDNGYTDNYNNNGYTSKYYNNGYKLAGESYEVGNQNSENGYTNTYYNNGNTNNYNNEGYTNKYYSNDYKLAGESHEAGNQNSENGYSNNGNTNNYNNKGYTNKYYNNGYKLAGESYEAGDQNSDNGYTRYETKRQGMSDTRFMEGGKYSYNVKNENYYTANKYESGKVSTQNQGSYGNDENPNEFNTMEEYKSQEGTYAVVLAPRPVEYNTSLQMDFGKEHCFRRARFVSAVAEKIYAAKYWQYRVPNVQANIRFCQDLFCCSSELLLRRGPDVILDFLVSATLASESIIIRNLVEKNKKMKVRNGLCNEDLLSHFWRVMNLYCHQGITDLLPSVVVHSPVEVELLLNEP